MANSVVTQVVLDGPRNVVVKVTGILDTSDQAAITVADPATMTGIDNTGALKALKLRLKEIEYIVEDLLTVNLYWDATAPVLLASYNGRGENCYDDFGGLPNNAGAGVNGKVLLSTEGWVGTKSFTLIMRFIKTQT